MRTDTSPRWNESLEQQFRALGFPGVLVAIFVCSFFAAQIVSDLTVLILYGPHAFFTQDLRVADWKHSVLSNGATLPWWGTLMVGPTIVPVWMLLILGAEHGMRRVRAFLGSKPAWATAVARIIGGAALLLFSSWLYSTRQGFPLLHPIPLSAFIGGVVVLCRVTASLFGKFLRSAANS